jgi:hypothetical protein
MPHITGSEFEYIHPFYGCGPEIFCEPCHRELDCKRKNCEKHKTEPVTACCYTICQGCDLIIAPGGVE